MGVKMLEEGRTLSMRERKKKIAIEMNWLQIQYT
jgi:hypothetical protein